MWQEVNELANFLENPNGQEVSVAIVDIMRDALSLLSSNNLDWCRMLTVESEPNKEQHIGLVEPISEGENVDTDGDNDDTVIAAANADTVAYQSDEETVKVNIETKNTSESEGTDAEEEKPTDETIAVEKSDHTKTDTEPSKAEDVQRQETEEKQELPFRRGALIEGVVTKTSPLEVSCSLGEEHEGIIPSRELERINRQQFEELLQIGNRLQVYVINPRDHKGRILLSVNRALEEQDWKQAQEFYREHRIFQGFVAGYNKGGLIVRFGRLRGFVPMSQIADSRRWQLGDQADDEKWRKQVNQPISVKVIEVNRKRSRLVLSESAAAREQREKRKAELISELSVGDVRTGPIVSLADFGVFVDLGGAEGLVHNSELSWRHVKHPRDIFQVGQQVRVEVINIDREKHRIGLSIKRQELDPWDEVAMRYTTGQLVQATITKLTKFGAFAQLEESPYSEGLIHISELADRRVEHPREVVQPGEKVTLRITRIDIRNRRLGLSVKRVNSAEYLDIDWLLASTMTSTADSTDETKSSAGEDSDDSKEKKASSEEESAESQADEPNNSE